MLTPFKAQWIELVSITDFSISANVGLRDPFQNVNFSYYWLILFFRLYHLLYVFSFSRVPQVKETNLQTADKPDTWIRCLHATVQRCLQPGRDV